jgi:hypothetical protein
VHVDSRGHLISTNIPSRTFKGSNAYSLRAQGSYTYLHAYILKMAYTYVYTIKSLPVLKSRCKSLPSHVIYLCLGSWFHSPPPFWWVRTTGAWDIPNMQGWTQLQPIPGPLSLGIHPPNPGLYDTQIKPESDCFFGNSESANTNYIPIWSMRWMTIENANYWLCLLGREYALV